MQELLIIRSAGFQQLDKNLSEIIRRFPNHRISLLTHEHGVQPARKYKDIDRIYVYPYTEGFHARRKVPDFKGKPFDAVIVLVSNLSGSGFSNVMRFSLTIRAKRRYICNLVSEIREVTAAGIRMKHVLNVCFAGLAGCATVIAALFATVFLLVQWKRIAKKE